MKLYLALFLLLFTVIDVDYSLTEQEKIQWNQLAQAEQQSQQNLNQIVNQAGLLQVEPSSSMQLHAAIKDALSQQRHIKLQREAVLYKLQADHDCKGCTVQDGKLKKP